MAFIPGYSGPIQQTAPSIVDFWDTAPSILLAYKADYSTSDVGQPNTAGRVTGAGGALTRGGFETAPTEWDVVRYGASLIPLPGLAIIKSVGRKIKLDKKRPAGADQAELTFLGYDPVHFIFELLFWCPEQLNDMTENAMPLIFPGKGQPIYQTTTLTTPGLQAAPGWDPGTFEFGTAGNEPGQIGPWASPPPGMPDIPSNSYTSTNKVGAVNAAVRLQHPALLFHGVRSVLFEKIDGPLPWRGHNDIFAVTCHTIQWAGPPKAIKSGTPMAPSPPTTNVGNVAANSVAVTAPSTAPSALAP